MKGKRRSTLRPEQPQSPLTAVPPGTTVVPLCLDIGCGPNPLAGFTGVDCLPFPGVTQFDVRKTPWPWSDQSVDKVNATHFLEHLTNLEGRWERVRFFNELYRILAPVRYEDGKPVAGVANIVIPHWCSQRYYGDPTHKEPFSEMALYYLDKNWRMVNAPHTDVTNNPDGYSCDFIFTAVHILHPEIALKSNEAKTYACQFYKEAVQDLQITLHRRQA